LLMRRTADTPTQKAAGPSSIPKGQTSTTATIARISAKTARPSATGGGPIVGEPWMKPTGWTLVRHMAFPSPAVAAAAAAPPPRRGGRERRRDRGRARANRTRQRARGAGLGYRRVPREVDEPAGNAKQPVRPRTGRRQRRLEVEVATRSPSSTRLSEGAALRTRLAWRLPALGSAEVDRGTCQRDRLVRVTVGAAHHCEIRLDWSSATSDESAR